ncbi:MAG: DsbA family protein [Tateyamaria sp.]|uniref:DsbA family protein n=1 Tax=Tateyamaria sp. TaxID=1929288 RepID=UPI00327C71A5
MKRRDLMAVGGLVALVAGWQVFGVRRPVLEFHDVAAAPGWQFAVLGGISAASGSDLMTIGLDVGPPALPGADLDAVVHRDRMDGAVPVAVFSDFFCPYCRGLIGRLVARGSAPDIAISWHELPLLGPQSVLVARAAEAAGLQGGYAAFYAQMLSDGFRPSPAWMATVAEAAGLDGARLGRDMGGDVVADRLLASARAAKTLGFIGTPGLAVGRYAVLGALRTDQMEDLIGRVGV